MELMLRPSAARLLESMRDIGYSFESALADIVDNSISAGATHIHIANDLDGELKPFLAILDNGRGMSSDELTAAMRHGSRSPNELRDAGDLGRFGLGMKTASFSQCRRLTVVSSQRGVRVSRCWDLDVVVERDEWILNVLDQEAIESLPMVDQLESTGTLVLWQKLDRLDSLGADPDQMYEALNAMFREARPHLALTFHRFIAPDSGDPQKKVSMWINGAEIGAVDPFARLSSPTSDEHQIEILRTASGDITVQGFTLPHHQRLSNKQLTALELGSSLVDTQGLYVYRARRLIASGSWLGLARRAELTKLLRVRVDVPNSLDSEWSIDVRKSRMRIPAAIRSRLRPLVEQMTNAAKRPYTYRGTRQTVAPGVPLWERVKDRGTIRYRIRRDHPMVEALQKVSGREANVDALLLAIEATLPLESLFSDVAESPKALVQHEMEPEELKALLAAFVEAMAPGKETLPVSIAEAILATPIFSNQSHARSLLKEFRIIQG